MAIFNSFLLNYQRVTMVILSNCTSETNPKLGNLNRPVSESCSRRWQLPHFCNMVGILCPCLLDRLLTHPFSPNLKFMWSFPRGPVVHPQIYPRSKISWCFSTWFPQCFPPPCFLTYVFMFFPVPDFNAHPGLPNCPQAAVFLNLTHGTGVHLSPSSGNLNFIKFPVSSFS